MSRIRNFAAMQVILVSLVVGGRAGAGQSPNHAAYPFELSPGEVVRLLVEANLAVEDAFSETRRRLGSDARDGKLDHFTFGEAVLIASGVADEADRQRYLDQLDRLEKEAEKALAGSTTKLEQGDRLLKFLHRQPMAGGYARHQTYVHAVLETGRFNCVSSAALFNVLAARLGHKVRAVEIPEHVFSLFYDGSKWVDVETTNKLGFNPARDRASREKLKKLKGVVYIPEKHADLRREIDQFGLLAILYYNHGVRLTKEERYGKAVIANFAALELDPANKSAVQNALANLNDWALALNDNHKFQKAISIVAVGLRAAPNDATLSNNRKVIWQDYARWEMQAGREDEAIAVLRRAAADVPDGEFLVRQAYLFEDQVDPLIRAGNMEEALSVVERGISKVDAPAQERLREWRATHVHNHVLQAMREKVNAEDYDAALSVIAAHAKWLDDESDVRSFQREVYDTWARKLAGEQKWQAAVDVYAAGLRQLPGDKHLSYNAAVNFDRWARSHMKNKDWVSAIAVYERALEQFPSNRLLSQNLNYCKRRSG